jgi:hypothetical protein
MARATGADTTDTTSTIDRGFRGARDSSAPSKRARDAESRPGPAAVEDKKTLADRVRSA